MHTHETKVSQKQVVFGNSSRQVSTQPAAQLRRDFSTTATPNRTQQLIDNSSRVRQLKASQQPLTARAAQRVAQRNVISGLAAQHKWDAKHVPQRVKEWAASAEKAVRGQYKTTLETLASNPQNNGDGMLAYLNGWNHKRFGGHFCLLYSWEHRRDGNGYYLNVKGIGKKNGNGQDYALDD